MAKKNKSKDDKKLKKAFDPSASRLSWEDLKDWSKVKWIISQNFFLFLASAGAALTFFLLIIALIVFGLTQQFITTLLLGGMLLFTPAMAYLYIQYAKVQEIEEYFPNFLRDLSEAQRAGVTLPKAIYNSANIDYGALSPEVKKMADQMSWGVPFEEAMQRFRNRVNSALIKRSVDIILEAHNAGGNISSIFDTITSDTQKIKAVESERKSKLQVNVYTVYMIYLIFIAIIIVLQAMLLPSLPAVTNIAKILGGTGELISEEALFVFLLHLSIIQGFFVGLLAGEISQGSVVAGLKHSMVLVFVGFILVSSLAAPTGLNKKISNTIALVPGSVQLEVDLGDVLVQENVSVQAIVGNLQETARSDRTKSFLNRITEESIELSDATCRVCGADTLYVTENGKELVVARPTRVNVSIRIDSFEYDIVIG